MTALTIIYITSRERHNFHWFMDSLRREAKQPLSIHVIFVGNGGVHVPRNVTLSTTLVKPSVWQGKHRLTKQDCWDASAARNTGLCLCETEWVAMLDDRCVLVPGWIACIEAAMKGNYAVFGAYEKRIGMTVEDGVIKKNGTVSGVDTREAYIHGIGSPAPWPCPGEWSFGCNLAMPLEWILAINGFDEKFTGGCGFEDVWIGKMIANNGRDIRYDYRFKVIQDRTPSELGPAMFKCDKGPPGTEQDKSHEIVRRLKDLKRAPNDFDIREMRKHVLAGGKFPIPTEPTHDWFDNSPLSEYG